MGSTRRKRNNSAGAKESRGSAARAPRKRSRVGSRHARYHAKNWTATATSALSQDASWTARTWVNGWCSTAGPWRMSGIVMNTPAQSTSRRRTGEGYGSASLRCPGRGGRRDAIDGRLRKNDLKPLKYSCKVRYLRRMICGRLMQEKRGGHEFTVSRFVHLAVPPLP
jgi:hypothetical protein